MPVAQAMAAGACKPFYARRGCHRPLPDASPYAFAGLRPSWKRKFVHTTDSKHALPVAENRLNRQFNPPAANQAWVADITYIRTRAGW